METAVSQSKQNVLQYIETTVSDGGMFAAIENLGTPSEKIVLEIKDIAK